MKIVATTSLPAVDRPNADRWSAARSRQKHVKALAQQGNFLFLAAMEYEDAIWKSYMFDMKQGTMKFLINAAIDTLPTASNLFKWRKSTSNKCKLCKSIQTTHHILNICKFSLENGKFLWRHNNIVNYVLECLDSSKFMIYSDLPGHTVGTGSVPPEICIICIQQVCIFPQTRTGMVRTQRGFTMRHQHSGRTYLIVT